MQKLAAGSLTRFKVQAGSSSSRRLLVGKNDRQRQLATSTMLANVFILMLLHTQATFRYYALHITSILSSSSWAVPQL